MLCLMYDAETQTTTTRTVMFGDVKPNFGQFMMKVVENMRKKIIEQTLCLSINHKDMTVAKKITL